MKKNGKIKKKKWNVYSTLQWFDLIPVGGIKSDVQKQHLIITKKTSVCIKFDQYYYGLDFFKQNDIQQIIEWQFLCKLSGVLGIVINLNSIGDKYQVGICQLN